jgi:DNA processing protein
MLSGAACADTAGSEGFSGTEQSLLTALAFEPTGLDALQARTGLDTPTLQALLMGLELQGHVARLPGSLFQRLARG